MKAVKKGLQLNCRSFSSYRHHPNPRQILISRCFQLAEARSGLEFLVLDIFQDEMPFDINAPIIEIPPEDYGIWFVDAMDNPDKYVDKIVRFKGRVMKPRGMGSKFFVPGRVAMTCCADDTTFLGYVCRSDYAPHIKEGSWVEVTAKVAFENRTEYQGEGIVLYASDVKECEPLKEEMVYFN